MKLSAAFLPLLLLLAPLCASAAGENKAIFYDNFNRAGGDPNHGTTSWYYPPSVASMSDPPPYINIVGNALCADTQSLAVLNVSLPTSGGVRASFQMTASSNEGREAYFILLRPGVVDPDRVILVGTNGGQWSDNIKAPVPQIRYASDKRGPLNVTVGSIHRGEAFGGLPIVPGVAYTYVVDFNANNQIVFNIQGPDGQLFGGSEPGLIAFTNSFSEPFVNVGVVVGRNLDGQLTCIDNFQVTTTNQTEHIRAYTTFPQADGPLTDMDLVGRALGLPGIQVKNHQACGLNHSVGISTQNLPKVPFGIFTSFNVTANGPIDSMEILLVMNVSNHVLIAGLAVATAVCLAQATPPTVNMRPLTCACGLK